MKLSPEYKRLFKLYRVPDRFIAEYTGHTREHLNNILNGSNMPMAKARHLKKELDHLLYIITHSRRKKRENS